MKPNREKKFQVGDLVLIDGLHQAKYGMDAEQEDEFVYVHDGEPCLVIHPSSCPWYLEKFMGPFVKILAPGGVGYISGEFLIKVQ